MFVAKLILQIRSTFKFVSVSPNSSSAMKYLGQREAIEIDQQLFATFSVDQLMELAGLSCAQALQSIYPKGNVLIVVGPGNNGGDGLVCGRHLKHFVPAGGKHLYQCPLQGYSPSILYPKPSNSELMQRLLRQTEQLQIPYLDSFPADAADQFSVIIDAIFGFSFKPPIREPFVDILRRITALQNQIPVFSIDIPSGWDVEKGPLPLAEEKTPILLPDALISLTAPKQCAQYFRGKHHFLGGRFLPPFLAKKFGIDLPQFEGSAQFLKF